MTRHEYLVRARELAARGEALPQTKLTGEDVREIRRLAETRERVRAAVNARLSSEALAARYGVHVRTIERVLSWERAA